jgi:putative methyltransferase (TIGR04325 family)
MDLSLYSIVKNIKAVARELPPFRKLRELDHERRFAKPYPGAFRGVYGSFDEALRSVPRTMATGYDNEPAAKMYRERMERAMPSDYPVLFWLSQLLRKGMRVFDYGGHVGVAYHCFERYLGYPDGLRWTVYDVPAVVREGEALARERGKLGPLSFTSRVEDMDGADILLAAGSLQYIEEDLRQTLARLAHKPRRLLISKLPIYDGETFVTVQNTGNAYHPYRISGRMDFERGIEGLGYTKRDEWTNGEQSCQIALHDEKTIRAYTGYLYERAS